MAIPVRVPLETRLQPMLVVCAPERPGHAAEASDDRRSSRTRLPKQLEEAVHRHPSEIEIRALADGESPDPWLAGYVSTLREPQRILLVLTEDTNTRPRAGFWAVISTATMLAREFGGSVYDLATDRLLDLDPPPGYFPPDGRIISGNHLVIPFSRNERGLIWMTTRGMRKFGLPELEVRDMPLGSRWFWFVLNGVAQRLIDLALDATDRDPSISELRVPGILEVDTGLLLRAYGSPAAGGFASTTTEIGLAFTPGAFPNGLIRVVPPKPWASLGRWLEEVGERLLPLATPPVAN